ncbi:nuclease-related domain-containing protein [Bacillus salacetis]|uniref:nuclease-related domain-containing protein n=1 Tax=Bacillus salacetis TaxID=2315464 RepID=UPI003B9DE7E9
MFFKTRSESDELLALGSLNNRMRLSKRDKHHYLNLEKGYEGEVQFDGMAEKRLEDKFVLNDLLLEVHHSYSQIDTLSISNGVIHLLNIKNYEGDYYFDGDKLLKVSHEKEYKNPLLQLQRSATIMRQILQDLQEDYTVKPFVVFVNPQFTLYQAPLNQPIIYPTQLNRFLTTLDNTPSSLSDKNRNLANKLVAMHKTKNPFTQLPGYEYAKLRKGIYCKSCRSYSLSTMNNKFICGKCREEEKFEKAILRTTKEFRLLFPGKKITAKIIQEWCNVDLSRRTFSRVLKRNFTTLGSTKDVFYE